MTKEPAVPKRARRPSPYRSPDEKRMRKQIRALIKQYDYKQIKQDDLVRQLYEMMDDERRRAFASMPPKIDFTPIDAIGFGPHDGADISKPFFCMK